MATAVDSALVEIQAALDEITPQLEGLRDFSKLNLNPNTAQEINVSIDQFSRRTGLLQTAHASLLALTSDGYPDVPVRELPDAAYKDLATNVSTIEAAFSKFASNVAVNLAFKSSKPQQKGPSST